MGGLSVRMSNSGSAIQWRFAFLGKFRAWKAEQPFPDSEWGRRRTMALLKLLLMAPGRLFSQDELVEILFSDLDISKAIPNLQSRISELRKVLEPDLARSQDSSFIETVNGVNYRLKQNAPYELDVDIFRQSLSVAGEHFEKHNWDEAVQRYREVIDQCDGEFLPEDKYEDWSSGERTRWNEGLKQHDLNYAHALAQQGNFEKALELVDRVIKSDPYRERAYRDRMLYSYLNGEQREAQEAYQRCAQRLRQELGILPSSESRTLFERICDQESLSLNTLELGLNVKSIAVLPFLNLSGDPKTEFFSDGLTEDIIAQIAKNRELRVISRTSVMRFKQPERSIADIARELKVSSIVEGSVRWSDTQVRVVVKLLRADSESPIWSEIYEQELTNIFEIQSDVANQIALALCDRIAPPSDVANQAVTTSVEAYQSYLRGRYFLNKRTEDDFRKSIGFFEAAIEKDPNYALAWTGLADAHALLSWFSYDPVGVGYPKALEYAQRALSINGSLSEAHASLAYVVMNYQWDWNTAETHFQKALELNPHNVTARHWHAELLAATGRIDEAVDEMRYALHIDPLSVLINTLTSWMIFFSRDYDAAIESCRNVLELDPRFSTAYWILGQVYFQKQDYKSAIESLEYAREYSNDHPSMLSVIGICHMRLGDKSMAHQFFGEAKLLSGDEDPNPIAMAVQALAFEDHPEALGWLQIAYEKRSWYMPYIQVDPFFDELKSYPEFLELIEELQLEKIN